MTTSRGQYIWFTVPWIINRDKELQWKLEFLIVTWFGKRVEHSKEFSFSYCLIWNWVEWQTSWKNESASQIKQANFSKKTCSVLTFSVTEPRVSQRTEMRLSIPFPYRHISKEEERLSNWKKTDLITFKREFMTENTWSN